MGNTEKNFRKLFIALITVIISVIIGMVLLLLVNSIPNEKMVGNIKESVKVFEREETYPQLMDGMYSSRLDNFTDAIILLTSAYKKDTSLILVSKKFALLKKPVNPSRFRTHPAVPELSALCIILAVFLKGGKNVSADSA